MKKKKPAVAKMQRPEERTAREREGRRWQAREAARYIRDGEEALFRGAGAAEDSDEHRKAMEQAGRCWLLAGLSITMDREAAGPFVASGSFAGVARKLRLVADVLEGKPIDAKYDDAIRKAYDKALRTGKRYHERPLDPDRVRRGGLPLPFLSEVHDALAVVLTKMGYTTMPTKDALRRRLIILGYGLSPDKPGQHRGKSKSRP